MTRLTWYVGSILPYASLWHTVNRAIWLNGLRPNELAEAAGMGRWRPASACEAMFDPSINIPRLARILGEKRSTFRNCTFSQLSSNAAKRYVIPQIRWCPVCIAHGYHSILGSLRLLAKCPIHGIPLQDHCPSCRSHFPSSIHPAHFWSPAICSCGATKLLLPETCRKPTLPVGATQAWAPVQKWLRDIEHVLQADQGRSVPWMEAMHIALVPKWCQELDISYPACFEREEAEVGSAQWTIYKASSGWLDVRASPPPPRRFEEIHGRKYFRTDSPEMSVYRAMAKHLRRHGGRRSDYWMNALRYPLDPVGFANKIQSREGARAAFSEMLWARCLEPRVYLRRWPCRPVETWDPVDLRGADDDSPFRNISPWWGSKKPFGYALNTWVSYHGMSLAALTMWAIALQRTREAADTGWADWSNDGPYLHGKIFWFARVRNGRAQFVGYVRDVDLQPFRSQVRSKSERIAEAAMQAPKRLAEVLAACRGPCLTWSERDGWHVVNDATPETSDIRLLRLRRAGRPEKLWLFEWSGHFVARLISVPLQAVAASPRAAIAGLRIAAKQYRMRYPDVLGNSREQATPAETFSEECRQRMILYVANMLGGTRPYHFWNFPPGAMRLARAGALRLLASNCDAATLREVEGRPDASPAEG